MTISVLTDCSITFQQLNFATTPPTPSGPVYDLSDHIASVVLETVIEPVEVTEVGQQFKRVIAGLGTNTVSFEFFQDFDVNSVEDIFFPWIGTRVQAKVKPSSGATAVQNPQYEFQVLIAQWTPLNAAVGSLSTVNVGWPISGPINKTTTP